MSKNSKKPLLPYVSVEGVEDFEIDRPETHKFSRLVNAVLEAFGNVRPISGVAVADFLDLPFPTLTGALKYETGLSYLEFYNYWMQRRLEKVVKENPGLQTDQLAQKVGFTNRSSLWKYLHKHNLVSETRNGDYEPRNCVQRLWREKGQNE